MNVLVTKTVPQIGIELLEKAGIEIDQWLETTDLSYEELIVRAKKADAVLSVGNNRIDANFLKECAHLKVVSLLSVGYDRVDVPAATALGIPIGNTPGVLSEATADTAFLLMLASSRKAFYLHKRIIRDQWTASRPDEDLGIDLKGKTLGIFGLGKIGLEMARRCRIYDMQVIYNNRQPNEEAEREFQARHVSFEELLYQSDVLSVHTALTAETSGRFDLNAFQKMKKNAIFINTARGGIHKEEDLIKALQTGLIWGAGLDVTNPEPMHADNPLLQMETVAVLPHIGSATVETRNAMASLAAENVIAGLKGQKLPAAVNPEVYMNEVFQKQNQS